MKSAWPTIKPPREPLAANGVTFISTTDALARGDWHAALWLSPHADVPLLSQFAARMPTLCIASGAVMEFYAQHKSFAGDTSALSPYQQSKLIMCNVPGVYVFVPGFYIEDVATPSGASAGLHGESTGKIFGPTDAVPEFDWERRYSVTPKTYLGLAVLRWLESSSGMPRNAPIIVCTDQEYSRRELRALAFGEGPPTFALPADKYAGYAHVPGIHRLALVDVKDACVAAAKLVAAKKE
jgi:hypothetical protein